MKMLFELPALEATEIKSSLLSEKGIKLFIARLDKLHPVISGNKLFKLHYFLEEALLTDQKTIITFGGAFSNHLLASAYACKLAGLESVGIVRGERPAELSATLNGCESYGMKLTFISRDSYKQFTTIAKENEIKHHFGKGMIIPEGGYHPLGAKGASLIFDMISHLNSTHICTAVGTATTLAGLLHPNSMDTAVIGIPVLKNMKDISERMSFLNQQNNYGRQIIFNEYHFGGYGKYNSTLINFINELYQKYQLPTDFVYTAKMMYGIFDKIKEGYFKSGDVITCLHTGGLQGNASLQDGTLVFK